MDTHADRSSENKSKAAANSLPKLQSNVESSIQFVDNRPEAIEQRALQTSINDSLRIKQLRTYQAMADNFTSQTAQREENFEEETLQGKFEPIQKKENNTGLPDHLKSGIENLSGYAMDDVKVHYNSDKPAQLQAHAYAQGTDIHLASGQEKHLPHEAWHVVQQKQGRVKATIQMKAKVNINDDAGLEKEADVMGAKAIQFVDNGPGAVAQRKRLELRKMDHQNENGPIQKVDWAAEDWAKYIGIPVVLAISVLHASGGLQFLGGLLLKGVEGAQAACMAFLRQVGVLDEAPLPGVVVAPAPVVAPAVPAWAPAVHPNDGNRAADPYELQNGQVHHIISHSHLVTGLNHLDQAAQNRVRRSFLPALNVLNIRQLATVFPNIVFTNPNALAPDNVIGPGLRYFEDAPWSTVPIAGLPGNITMAQGAFINTTIGEFRNAYHTVREDAAGGPGNVGTLNFWQEVLNSFFEWSGGNLFYGPGGRAEPGGVNLDELDSDAAYFRDPSHVNALSGMERRLRAANQAVNAHNIENILIEIGVANRDAGAGPVNAPGMWFTPVGIPQETFVAALLPAGPRKDYVTGHTGRYLPRALVRERIRSTVDTQLKAALVNAAARANFSGAISDAAKNAHRWKGVVNPVNTVDLNLWGSNFTLTSIGAGNVQITALGLQSIVSVGSDVTSIGAAIQNLKSGMERLF